MSPNRILLLILTLVLLPIGAKSQSNVGKIATLEKQISFEKNERKAFSLRVELYELLQLYNLEKADSLADMLLSSSVPLHDSLRLQAILLTAEKELRNGNRSGYCSLVLSAQSFINRIPNLVTHAQIQYHLARYHIFQNEFETADFYINQAIKSNRQTNAKAKSASLYLLRSELYLAAHQKDSAIANVDLAIKFARRISDRTILATCFNQQARIFEHFGQIELSVAKNILALQLAKESGNPQQISAYSREIGMAQYSIHNLNESSRYFKQALQAANSINDRRQIALAKLKLSNVEFANKNFKRAIELCDEAKGTFDQLKDLESLGKTHNTLGLIYKDQKDFNLAASNFNQALIYFEQIGALTKIADVYHNVGTVFYAQGKYKNALSYLNRSLELSQSHSYTTQWYKNYKILSDVYRSLGQYDKAFLYNDKYIQYVDSSTYEQAAAKIAELNELYQAEQRDRLILTQADELQRQNQEKALTKAMLENAELRNNMQAYVILGFGIIILLAGIIIFYRWKQTQMQQQQREAEMAQTLLRTQMNPHFVFNAMSVIQSYIYENDIQNSTKFLVNFSRLMRLILENSSKEEIPIRIEEEILTKYMETQKLRFEDRFNYYVEIEDGLQFENAMIPPMIIQPFIENSIEHGQLHTIKEGGFIKIQFRKNKNMLEVELIDNGVGRKGAEMNRKSKEHKSMAMAITKERIDNLNKKYKTEGFLRIEDYNKELQTGTKILLSLPYRTDNNQLNS